MVTPLVLRIEAFTRLSPDERVALAEISKVTREISPRRDVICEGDRPHYIHLIVHGWGCRYKNLPHGRRQILGFFIPGDFCDLNVYILKQMDHSIGAITRMRVADISREDMDRITERFPRVTQAFWWHELVNVSVQREWTVNVGQRTAYERIAHLLVELFLRLEVVGMTQGDSCDFPITQTDLAEASGLTSVHVNRTLQELRKNGLIEMERKRLRIPSLERLKGVAMFNPNYLHLEREGRHLDSNA